MNRAGYHTSYIGKWHLAPPEYHFEVPKEHRGGYQQWLGANILEFCSDAYDCVMFDDDNNRVKMPGYRVDAQTDAAIRYLNSRQDARDPFFLFCSYLEPHHQNRWDSYPAPRGYAERYRGRWTPPDLAALEGFGSPHNGGSAQEHLAGYWGMIKRLDEAFGRVLDALESLEMLDNTVILFVSDHGCHFKTRNAEYKRSAHESSIHIPMVWAGPGFEQGGYRRELVSLIDVMPTLLDIAGAEIPEDLPGNSLLAQVQGRREEPWPDDVFVQISEAECGRAIRTHRWKYAITAPSEGEGETGSWNSSNQASADLYEEKALYDLEHDPYELNNLIGRKAYKDVLDDLRERLVHHIKAVEGYQPEIRLTV
jgi:arylsulfatase A-like enzyme